MMHGNERSVRGSGLADLAGQYYLSLIEIYVPEHSSCMGKTVKHPQHTLLETPQDAGKSVCTENWQGEPPGRLTLQEGGQRPVCTSCKW